MSSRKRDSRKSSVSLLSTFEFSAYNASPTEPIGFGVEAGAQQRSEAPIVARDVRPARQSDGSRQRVVRAPSLSS